MCCLQQHRQRPGATSFASRKPWTWRPGTRPSIRRGVDTPRSLTIPSRLLAKIRPQSVYGFSAMHLMPNASHVERTRRDARLDGMDHYYALFSVVGNVKVIQDDRAVELAAGQVLLVEFGKTRDLYGGWKGSGAGHFGDRHKLERSPAVLRSTVAASIAGVSPGVRAAIWPRRLLEYPCRTCAFQTCK